MNEAWEKILYKFLNFITISAVTFAFIFIKKSPLVCILFSIIFFIIGRLSNISDDLLIDRFFTKKKFNKKCCDGDYMIYTVEINGTERELAKCANCSRFVGV